MDVEGLGQVETTFAEKSPCLSANDPERRCFADCKHIFLDLGSNIGMHARFLFEPHQYSKSLYSKWIFNDSSIIPSREDRMKVCMIGWEPNVVHRDRLRRLSAYLKKKGFRADWIFAGVSSTSRNISFVHAGTKMDMKNSEWGFSRVRHNIGKKDRSTSEMIKAMDISLFMHQHLDIKYNGKPKYDPTIIMKMDVEVEEYRIIPKMVATGVFCRIRVLTIEWHGAKFGATSPSIQIGRSEDAIKRFLWKLGRDELCSNTTILNIDDERYVTDTKWGKGVLRDPADQGKSDEDESEYAQVPAAKITKIPMRSGDDSNHDFASIPVFKPPTARKREKHASQ